VTATDYRDDIRISENILKRLSEAYRRIRNTCRFILGNLSDFNPEEHREEVGRMPEIDRYALHQTARLIEKGKKAYDDYEFHVIYHALHNFCAVDLSAFYLDILKDRLYTSSPESQKRRCAQTAMYYILDAVVKMMAPILPFTAEEVWKFMPKNPGAEKSVHMTIFPEFDPSWKDDKISENWKFLREVRGEATRLLEKARAEKKIGHSLDASVTLSANGEVYDKLKPYEPELRSLFIVSEAELVKGDEGENTQIGNLYIQVKKASGEKCERCWVHSTAVGMHENHPTICTRCRDALKEIL
jgi:isoleucyl-tRNA synthetase